MTRPNCPRCRRTLEEHGRDEARLLACTACGGVWLGTAEAAQALQELGPRAELAEQIAKRATLPVDEEAPVRCPIDGQPLQRVIRGSISIDTCAAHGSWFDCGELSFLATSRPPPPNGWGPGSGGGSSSSSSSGDSIFDAILDAIDRGMGRG